MKLVKVIRYLLLGVICAPFVIVILGTILLPIMVVSFIGEFLVTGKVTTSYRCFINTPKEWGPYPE